MANGKLGSSTITFAAGAGGSDYILVYTVPPLKIASIKIHISRLQSDTNGIGSAMPFYTYISTTNTPTEADLVSISNLYAPGFSAANTGGGPFPSSETLSGLVLSAGEKVFVRATYYYGYINVGTARVNGYEDTVV